MQLLSAKTRANRRVCRACLEILVGWKHNLGYDLGYGLGYDFLICQTRFLKIPRLPQ